MTVFFLEAHALRRKAVAPMLLMWALVAMCGSSLAILVPMLSAQLASPDGLHFKTMLLTIFCLIAIPFCAAAGWSFGRHILWPGTLSITQEGIVAVRHGKRECYRWAQLGTPVVTNGRKRQALVLTIPLAGSTRKLRFPPSLYDVSDTALLDAFAASGHPATIDPRIA